MSSEGLAAREDAVVVRQGVVLAENLFLFDVARIPAAFELF
jgi:hypothetical protein